MLSFIGLEFLKLKRSKMFSISLVGAILPPVIVFISMLYRLSNSPDTIFYFKEMFNEIAVYSLLMFSIILYGLIIAHLFSIEYREHTLKSILSSPISRNYYVAGKFLMFLIWVVIITCVEFSTAVILLDIGGCVGLTSSAILYVFKRFFVASILLAFPMFICGFLTVLFRKIIPVAIFSMGFGVVNSMILSSDVAPLFPWCSPVIISSFDFSLYAYTFNQSLLVIVITAIIGFAVTLVAFEKSDSVL